MLAFDPRVGCEVAEHGKPERSRLSEVCDVPRMQRVEAAVDHRHAAAQFPELFERDDHARKRSTDSRSPTSATS